MNGHFRMVEEIPEQNILERKTTNRKCFRKIGTVSVKVNSTKGKWGQNTTVEQWLMEGSMQEARCMKHL